MTPSHGCGHRLGQTVRDGTCAGSGILFYLTGLKSCRTRGLTSQQAEENRKKYGDNSLTPPKHLHPFLKFLLQFNNFFAYLLLAGGTLCFIAYGIDGSDQSNLYLGIVLYFVVVVTAIFSFYQVTPPPLRRFSAPFRSSVAPADPRRSIVAPLSPASPCRARSSFLLLQESKSEAIMEGFKQMIPRMTTVIRDGQSIKLEDTSTLTVGDLVEVGAGDTIPADIRVIVSYDMKVDNASLTGESEPQTRVAEPHLHPDKGGKHIAALEANNLAFYTTTVSSGKGSGFIIGIGDNTAMGKIAGLVTGTDAEETPIAREIEKFILLISGIAIVLGITFLIVSIAIGQGAVASVVFAIGIIVANVPEGLLVTVTVALALTAKRMFAKNVLVKNLQAVETLGSTSVIASDKTGTLTQNRMTVQHCWVNGDIYRVPTARNVPQLKELVKKGEQNGEKLVDIDHPSFQALRRVGALCNNARLILETGDKVEVEGSAHSVQAEPGVAMYSPDFNVLTCDATSDASEQGLVKALQLMRDVEEERRANPKSFEIPFNSTNKFQLSIHDPEEGGSPLLVFKGAPERVINFCSYININGKAVPLTDEWRKRFNDAYETLGGFGERVLGFAYKSLSGRGRGYNPGKDYRPPTDLVFAGLFSLIDPPKEGVPEAVEKCKSARIRVFMVTGDHPITAVAIAKQVGIIDQEKWDSGNAAVVKVTPRRRSRRRLPLAVPRPRARPRLFRRSTPPLARPSSAG